MATDVMQWQIDPSLPVDVKDFLRHALQQYRYDPMLATAVVQPFDHETVTRYLRDHAACYNSRVNVTMWRLLVGRFWPEKPKA